MSSCCAGNCGCGSACKCSGCKMFPDITENNPRETLVLGVAASKVNVEGSEMGVGAENGCKCGDNCTCDPCNCK